MELAHSERVEIQTLFKKADFFRPVLRPSLSAVARSGSEKGLVQNYFQ